MTTRTAHSKTKRSAPSDAHHPDPELVQDLQNRLRCLEGHVRGIRRMVDEQASYEDLLIQTSAVRAALSQINIKIIEGHMQAYMMECAKRGDVPVAMEQLESALAQVLKNT